MRTLCLLRHATAHNGADDATRTLTAEGRAEARRVGVTLLEGGWMPDRVLCSTAVRARETLACAQAGATGRLDGLSVTYDERLYLAPAERLLSCVTEVEEDCATLLLVAHNPGMNELSMRLAARDPQAAGKLSRGFPPATLAVVTCETSWPRFGADPCQLVAVKLSLD